eukprot:12644011-Ditylum_brightwellii.AAC.1
MLLKQPGSPGDRGTKFMAEFIEMIDCPQANGITERIHQTTENMIRSFEVHETTIDEKDPCTVILSAVKFLSRAIVHTTMQTTSMQIAFGRNAILNVKHEANWKYINEIK